MTWHNDSGDVRLIHGDCLDVMPTIEAGSVDAIVCDPPYGLTFMGKNWDHGVPGPEYWQAAKQVVKPGAFLFAFGGSRTFHRLACSIEDAGWTIRDTLSWLYGTGFPKSKSCLKPGWEPIIVAKAPGELRPLGIDEARLGSNGLHEVTQGMGGRIYASGKCIRKETATYHPPPSGRWPANVILSHHPACNGQCHEDCPIGMLGEQAGERKPGSDVRVASKHSSLAMRGSLGFSQEFTSHSDSGTAARFFYCSKASRKERGPGNIHPTVKPIDIIEWLIKLACPPGGTVLDPFIGSGTTALAALNTGRKCIGIERDPGYFEIARGRVAKHQRPLITS